MHPVISCEDFIDFFKSQRNDKHTKYCFIMGSGCSVENGIATGWALADKWYRELPDHYSGDEIAAQIKKSFPLPPPLYQQWPGSLPALKIL